jgi:hypothetical protein
MHRSTITSIVMATMSMGLPLSASALHVKLFPYRQDGVKAALCSDKTTEEGEDEVYLIVKTEIDGKVAGEVRLPANIVDDDRGHWDMNDGAGDENHCRVEMPLAEFDLTEGQVGRATVFTMEEDGGSLEKLAGKVGIKFDVFDIKDIDDYIGAFAVTVRNNGGKPEIDWAVVDRVFTEIPNNQGPNTHEYRMNGDGSNYVFWVKVDAN